MIRSERSLSGFLSRLCAGTLQWKIIGIQCIQLVAFTVALVGPWPNHVVSIMIAAAWSGSTALFILTAFQWQQQTTPTACIQTPEESSALLLASEVSEEYYEEVCRVDSADESGEEVVVESLDVTEKVLTPHSRAVWRRFRMCAWVPDWRRQYADAKAALEKTRNALTQLGSTVEAAQRRYEICVRHVHALEMRKPKPETDQDMVRYDREFEQLCELPDVLRVMMGKRRIQVWTRAIHVTIGGVLYTLGHYRFEIRFAPTGPFIFVVCVESGRTDGLKQHPHGAAAEGGFCFGTRREQINVLLGLGEYLPVIILMLEGIRHVNADLFQIVIVNYKPVENIHGSTLEKLNGLHQATTDL